MIKKMIKKLNTNSSEKHNCIDNREVIDELPQIGKICIDGHSYHVKCKICGKDWFQNYR